MANIDHQIKQKVDQLKEQFRKTLMKPLTEYREKDVELLNQKLNYQRLKGSL